MADAHQKKVQPILGALVAVDISPLLKINASFGLLRTAS
jgi:hypothetical protein